MHMSDMATQCDVKKSRVKCGTTHKAFKVHCFLWERGAPYSAVFGPFNCQNLLHAQEPI